MKSGITENLFCIFRSFDLIASQSRGELMGGLESLPINRIIHTKYLCLTA